VSVIAELKRRNVFRVAALYLVAAWVLLQVSDLLFDLLGLPTWTNKLLFAGLVLGFVPALIFSWVYELTPEGLKREHEVERNASVTAETARKLDLTVVGLLVIAIGVVAVERFIPRTAPVPAATDAAPNASSAEAPVQAAEKSIAVLPFVNMSNDPDQESFADGISEEILNTLAAIRELQVVGRTSSFQFKGRNEDLRVIGEKLNVAHILEGSIRKSGDRVRITAQLVNVEDGFHLWSETFDRQLEDIFAIQQEIAEAVGSALRVELGIAVQQSVARRSTDNLEAYSLYLQAREYLFDQDVGKLRRALELSRQVMDMDPDFLPGRLQYAWIIFALASWGVELPGETLNDAERIIQDVIDRDPLFADAWLQLGSSHANRYQWRQAEAAFARAKELDPSLSTADNAYALLVYLGRTAEAAERYKAYIDREPLALNERGVYAEALAALGRMDEAEAEFRRLLNLDAGYSAAYYRVGTNYFFRLGRIADAVPWYRKAMELDPSTPWYGIELAQALLELGAVDESRALIAGIAESSTEIPVKAFVYKLARAYGDDDMADAARENLARSVNSVIDGLNIVEDWQWLRDLHAQDAERALALYRRISPELFHEPPEVGTWNHGIALSLALLQRDRGERAEAERLAHSVLEVIDTTNDLYGYGGAATVAWLALGDESRAMAALEQTFREEGRRVGWSFIKVDPVYAPLRPRAEFQSLDEEIRVDMARQLQALRSREASDDGELVLDFGD
jgi:TolB-like protein/thioredoxin-like negative regulator of GroEL